MRRRVVKIVTVVSAVVCVGSLLLVGRSFFVGDVVRVPFETYRSCGAASVQGQLIVFRTGWGPHQFAYFRDSTSELGDDLDQTWNGATGIRQLGIGWRNSDHVLVLILPLWLLPIVTAILPVWWWVRRRRAGRRGFEVVGEAARKD
jgi:hypothetical protein